MGDDRPDAGRRDVIQRLALGAGGFFVFPLVAAAHPIQHHFRDQSTVGLADAKATAPDYAPEFLDAHQMAMLERLAERVVPGSTKASSAGFIDQLLSVAAPDDQRAFLQALGAFERLAIARTRLSWMQLTADQQHAMLTIASTEEPGATANARGPSRAASVTIRDHFENLKGWIVGAYYSSELGMRELGWTETMFFPAFPGCEHDQH